MRSVHYLILQYFGSESDFCTHIACACDGRWWWWSCDNGVLNCIFCGLQGLQILIVLGSQQLFLSVSKAWIFPYLLYRTQTGASLSQLLVSGSCGWWKLGGLRARKRVEILPFHTHLLCILAQHAAWHFWKRYFPFLCFQGCFKICLKYFSAIPQVHLVGHCKFSMLVSMDLWYPAGLFMFFCSSLPS